MKGKKIIINAHLEKYECVIIDTIIRPTSVLIKSATYEGDKREYEYHSGTKYLCRVIKTPISNVWGYSLGQIVIVDPTEIKGFKSFWKDNKVVELLNKINSWAHSLSKRKKGSNV